MKAVIAIDSLKGSLSSIEAGQAIAEGMSIYGGEIAFDDSVLAELAERVWDIMEEKDRKGFRRINTMLEE